MLYNDSYDRRKDMPPIRKVQREDIVNISLEILKNESMESLNARRIAKELNCSVQPIFYNFENMDDLKTAVFNKIYSIYLEYMNKGSKEENAYKGMGLAYIRFAKDYPNYFKTIFMNKTDLTPDVFIDNDDMGNNIIKYGMEFTGFDYETQKDFHLKVWIFTHGLATLVATKTVKISDEEVEKLLEETVMEMVTGIKRG